MSLEESDRPRGDAPAVGDASGHGRLLQPLARGALARLRAARSADRAALWASGPDSHVLRLAALDSDTPIEVPDAFADSLAAAGWATAGGWEAASLGAQAGSLGPGSETRRFVAVGGGAPRPDLPPAFAFRLAELEVALEQERSALRTVFESASDAIVGVDADRRVVRHNPAAVALLGRADAAGRPVSCCEYLGCDARSDAPGTVTEASRPGEPACGPICPFSRVLAGSPPILAYERTTVGRNSARIPVAATYARTAGPEPAAIAVFRDLRGAQALDELKSSFVAAVSHELRTPLALISGYSQTLMELDLDDVARRRFVERIDGTTNRLRGLVDELLDVATLESDRLAVNLRRVGLRPLLKSIIDEVAEMPGSLAVSLSVPPDLPPVYADPSRMAQVVGNLLDNARKYGRRDSMVTIRVRRAGDDARVCVDNDGPRIDPEEREMVFERFYRGRQARTSGTGGIGLGLHLCRRLVEAHGGRIWLEDRAGGTRVCLTLPLALDTSMRTAGGGPGPGGLDAHRPGSGREGDRGDGSPAGEAGDDGV